MKKILYLSLAVLLSGSLLIGCGGSNGGDDDKPTPKGPSISFQNNGGTSSGYTFANENLNIGTSIKIGVNITSDINLKSTKLMVKFNNQAEVLVGTDSLFSNNTKTCSRDYFFTLPMDKGVYTFTAYATDKDATTSQGSIVITAVGPLTDRGVGEVYSLKATGTGKFSAYDLLTGEAITAATGAGNEAQRDIVDQSTGAALSRTWTSQNGTQFLMSDASGKLNNKVYSQFKSEQDVLDAWNAGGNKSTTITGIDDNRLIIAKSTRNGSTFYYLIAISTVTDVTGSENDLYEFQYKQ